MKDNNLEQRTFDFSVSVIQLLKSIKYSKVNDVIKHQLAKAATSVGANYGESQGAFSKEDFKFKISICFKEARESNYWLRIIKAVNISTDNKLDVLIGESLELKKIFASIMKKLNDKEKDK